MEYTAHTIWLVLRTVILIILTGYIGLSFLLTMFQSKMVYYPLRTIETDPGTRGLRFEDIIFESSDKVKLHGWYVPAEQQKGVVLFCHGNGGNISHRLDTIDILTSLGLSVFIFDYRGYGRSEGKPYEKGTYADAEAAFRWIIDEKNKQSGDIIIMGRSLGGAIAAWLANKYTPKALIIESAFTSIPDIGAELHPMLPVRLLSRFKYSTADYITGVNCPVLIAHSPDDKIIPFSHGQSLFASAHKPKEFLALSGGHSGGFLISGDRYVDGLENFIFRISDSDS